MLRKIIFMLLPILFFIPCASAQNDVNETLLEQFKLSGAEKLMDFIPKETEESLNNMGVNGSNFSDITKITPSKIFDLIIKETKNKVQLPLKVIAPVIGTIVLCAMVDCIDLSLGNTNMSDIMSSIGGMCICTCIVTPLVSFIASVSSVIKGVSVFIMCFIPVMAGIMIASGQTVTASSYQVTMLCAGEIISQLCTNMLVPLMSTILGLAVISSMSPKLKMQNICTALYTAIRWCLYICTSIFTILLALQNIISAPADSIGNKTAKLAVSSFVPIVGNALSDAFNTVQSCVKLLKSGVGAFGILAAGLMFLPAAVECCVWRALLGVCCIVSDILVPGKISVLLKSVERVVQVMLAVIFSCATVLIVSTVIILLLGNGA